MDETYVRVGGRWMYLFRAVDNRGDTVDFYLSERVTVTRPSASCRPHSRIPITGRPGSFLSMETVAIEQRSAICAMMGVCQKVPISTVPLPKQPHQIRASARKASLVRHAGARTPATARVVIQGIEAAQMIRKGQVLGIPRDNRRGQAWVFGALLGLE